jgi:flagellar biosynthetic protein FliQ
MNMDLALQLMTSLLASAVKISAPLLVAVLTVGLIVSVFQVVTQIQEMSLTYLPKLSVAVLVLLLGGPWMLRQLMSFTIKLWSGIPQMF